MAKNKSKKAVTAHVSQAIENLEEYLNGLTEGNSAETKSQADKLAYWIEDYTRFLSKEKTFKWDDGRRLGRKHLTLRSKCHIGVVTL